MESSAVLRSFHCSVGVSNVPKLYGQRLVVGEKVHCSSRKNGALISCVKTSESPMTSSSNASSDSIPQGSAYKNAPFPSGFEALVLEVCDETKIAELKLKIGNFEMHVKRNIGATKAPLSNILPTTPPPISAKPREVSAPDAAPPPPSPAKSSSEKATPFANVSFGKAPKLAALEASGSTNYVLVSSPTVGSFRKNRTIKGKKQPPICKEGDVIKDGQVIGYLDQFGTELPVKSNVDGEVLKILFDDGDAVGFGDSLIAVLPAFHGIR
jgi:biotin carboxyl carrier protein